MSSVQLSKGSSKPASPHLLSEAAIVAGVAKAVLPQSKTRWDWYAADYDRRYRPLGTAPRFAAHQADALDTATDRPLPTAQP